MRKIILIGNMMPDTDRVKNRMVGRVYSSKGICPTLRAVMYKDPPRILISK